MKQFIQIHPLDNVAVALQDLEQGMNIPLMQQQITLQSPIARGHKFALSPIQANEHIIKYGLSIGHATQPIGAGEHVHSVNLKTNLKDLNQYQYHPENPVIATERPDRDVMLYRRTNGNVAIRNELWIIPTVGCVNGIARQLIERFKQQHPDLSDIDGIHLFSHPYGCSQLGNDHINTRTMLQNIVVHPNAGAVLVIGLGCENNQIDDFKNTLGNVDDSRVAFMICQQYDDEIAIGLSCLDKLYQTMRQDKRHSGKLSEVHFGLECGGSDGLSGITANPLLGCFSDYLTSHNGTTVLTEVPEMFGAEQLLMNHCYDETVFETTVTMINDFKRYFHDHQQPIYENPSPGNKAGGITTLEEKSLGCTQKAGQGTIVDVLKYGERLKKKGVNLLSAPGNDAVATSALAAAGCHVVLFSTGRGTPYGGFVPTVKISTNSELAARKPHWIDFDAGQLLYDVPMVQLLENFIDTLVLIVNGQQQRCNERNEFRELAIFKSGVTL